MSNYITNTIKDCPEAIKTRTVGALTPAADYVYVGWMRNLDWSFTKFYIAADDYPLTQHRCDDEDQGPQQATLCKVQLDGKIRCGACTGTATNVPDYVTKHAIKVSKAQLALWKNAGILLSPDLTIGVSSV